MNFLLYNINDFTDCEYDKWFSLMSDAKKQKVNSLRFSRDKKLSVCGEMLARTLISNRLNVSADNIRFSIDEFGKPYAEGLDIHFNISHSGDFAVCAVDEQPIGVDIERIKPSSAKTAVRFFSDSEFYYVFNCEKQELKDTEITHRRMLMRFFEVWTKREAMAKCSGKGLLKHNFTQNYKTTTLFLDNYVISLAKN